jgi:hypothetical protein
LVLGDWATFAKQASQKVAFVQRGSSANTFTDAMVQRRSKWGINPPANGTREAPAPTLQPKGQTALESKSLSYVPDCHHHAVNSHAPAEDVRPEAEVNGLLSDWCGKRLFSAAVGVSGNSTTFCSVCGQLRQRMFRTWSQ